MLETVFSDFLYHAISAVRRNVRANFSEAEIPCISAKLSIPFSRLSLNAESSISHFDDPSMHIRKPHSNRFRVCPAGQVSNAKHSVVSLIMINNAAGIIPCVFAFAAQIFHAISVGFIYHIHKTKNMHLTELP